MNIPVAAYRIQFGPDMSFDKARSILPYLKELGVSHVYASPIFAARQGSTHGYDVVDHARINPELGGSLKLDLLFEKTKELGMGWLQDIVPNHMAYDSANPLLMDVLEKGAHSRYYGFFDINWHHPYKNLSGRLLCPFLGSFYGDCLDQGEITIGIDAGGFFLRYYQFRLPVSKASYPKVLEYCKVVCRHMEAGENGNIKIFDQFMGQFVPLVQSADEDAYKNAKTGLWKAYTEDQNLHLVIDAALNLANGQAGNPDSFAFLDKLLDKQQFRLSFWKVGNDELNYRRFFTINDLISLSAEKPEVFDYSHGLVLELCSSGKIDGLRVDHIDGLYAPLTYLRRLRERARDAYIVCEKILMPDEELQTSWPVQGTTGYELLNILNGLFIDKESFTRMTRFYIGFTSSRDEFERLVASKKRLFMGKHMAGDIDNLAQLLRNILAGDRYGSDFTLYGLRRALVEVMAHFPVYRTYSGDIGLSDSDRFYVKKALDKARRSNQELLYELDFIEKTLLSDVKEKKMSDRQMGDCRHFTRRFQQYSGALMAKGAEDTTFYIYNRLISLNEVGGDPSRFGTEPAVFHSYISKRASVWPASMNTTSTHDTKRGEDTRARINVLTELANEWTLSVRRWSKFNQAVKARTEDGFAPDNNDEYFIYQTLIGAMPFSDQFSDGFRQRIKDSTIKSVREAKIHTAWLMPDNKYEQACLKFIDTILTPADDNKFLKDFAVFQNKVSFYGVFNSLSQLLMKLCLPGVPDIYQGTELWDLNLVDPDNRRGVNFEHRKRIFEKVRSVSDSRSARVLLDSPQNGAIKMLVMHKALTARNLKRDLFEKGAYLPLEVKGKFSGNIVAFARRSDSAWALCAVPRFTSQLVEQGKLPIGVDVWLDTSIVIPEYAPIKWSDAISSMQVERNGEFLAGSLFAELPLCLLIGE